MSFLVAGFSSILLSRCNAALAFRDTVDWSAGKYGLGEEVDMASKRKYHVSQSVSLGMVLQKKYRSAVLRA